MSAFQEIKSLLDSAIQDLKADAMLAGHRPDHRTAGLVWRIGRGSLLDTADRHGSILDDFRRAVPVRREVAIS